MINGGANSLTRSGYARLADLSVSHLYNLRKRADYQAQRVSFVKTRPVCYPIGLR